MWPPVVKMVRIIRFFGTRSSWHLGTRSLWHQSQNRAIFKSFHAVTQFCFPRRVAVPDDGTRRERASAQYLACACTVAVHIRWEAALSISLSVWSVLAVERDIRLAADR